MKKIYRFYYRSIFLKCKFNQKNSSRLYKEIFRLHPEVKCKLWGGDFWTSGYYVNTVGQYGNEDVIQKYIQNQGEEKAVYKSFNKNQLRLSFE